MPTHEGLTRTLGADWEFTVPCLDDSGAALNMTGGSAQLRIASAAALLIEATATFATPANGVALFHVAPGDQSAISPSTLYQIEARSVDAGGEIAAQLAGTLYVADSLFVRFPVTNARTTTDGAARTTTNAQQRTLTQ